MLQRTERCVGPPARSDSAKLIVVLVGRIPRLTTPPSHTPQASLASVYALTSSHVARAATLAPVGVARRDT